MYILPVNRHTEIVLLINKTRVVKAYITRKVCRIFVSLSYRPNGNMKRWKSKFLYAFSFCCVRNENRLMIFGLHGILDVCGRGFQMHIQVILIYLRGIIGQWLRSLILNQPKPKPKPKPAFDNIIHLTQVGIYRIEIQRWFSS